MNTTLMHRRRVERFAQLLDEAEGARRHHRHSAVDDELADLLDTGNRLAEIETPVVMREARRVAIRAELLKVAEEQGIGATAKRKSAVGRAQVGSVVQPTTQRRPFARRVRARGAILVGLAVGAVAISGIAAASGGAMPGDPLYGLKLSQEHAELAMARTQTGKGQLYLTFAGRRLAEAQRDNVSLAEFNSLLAAMDTDTENGTALMLTDALSNRDARSIGAVNAFYDAQFTRVDGLLDRLSSDDPRRTAVLNSEGVLRLVDERVSNIAGAIACRGSVTTTAADGFGPNATCTSG